MRLTAGVDATARGALFGPDLAAAVILRPSALDLLKHEGVRDSKQVRTEKERAYLAKLIRRHSLAWAMGFSSVQEINRSADQAEYRAMFRAVMQLKVVPHRVLVDGKWEIPGLPFDQEAIPQGDSKELCIAAASIIAKSCHDFMIRKWDKQYPGYGLMRNKAHCSSEHERAIASLGLTKLHRNCAAKFATRQLVLEF